MAVITFSRQMGAGAEDIARQVCEILGYDYLDKELITAVAADVGLSEDEVIDFSEENYKVRSFMDRILQPGPRYVGQVVTRVRDEETGAPGLTIYQLNEIQCINLNRSTLRAAYQRGNMVIVGRGGQAVLQEMPDVLHVRVEAPVKDRIVNIQRQQELPWEQARQLIAERDEAASQYLDRFFGIRWDDSTLYHMVINTGKLGIEESAQLVAKAAELL